MVDLAVVQTALGVTSPDHVARPTAADPGSCSWHSADPSCNLRSLSVQVRRGVAAVNDFAAVQTSAAVRRDVTELGLSAFTSAELMPIGAAIQISHLDVVTNDTWVRITLSGRINPDAADGMLRRVATASIAGTDLSQLAVTDAGLTGLEDAASAEPPTEVAMPDLDVVDIASGETLGLRSLVGTGQPTLVWVWAPSCPICNQEAGDVETFAAQHASSVSVVGLGGYGRLDAARDFVADHELTTPKMVFDPFGESFVAFAVYATPATLVFDADGHLIRSWAGGFDADTVLDLVAGS
jgi:hypothetical protein